MKDHRSLQPGGPSRAEILRMQIIDELANTLPVAFLVIPETRLDRLEDNLDRIIGAAFRAKGTARQ